MMHCPVCKAVVEQPQCRRCRADLSLLFALDEKRQRLLTEASQALLGARPTDAVCHANQANQLRAGADARRLLALGRLFQRDFAAAWRYYQEEKTFSGEQEL
jgi:hypothetical protein